MLLEPSTKTNLDPSPPVNGPKILICDDESDTLVIVKFWLTKAGYQVVLAENGEEALELAHRENPDMAILDRMMPGMDGIEVGRQLRANYPHMFIVMLTAMGREEDRLAAWETGVDDYITKPFNSQELVYRVKAIMRRDRQPPETAGPKPETARSNTQMQTKELEERHYRPLSVSPTDPAERKLQALLLRASRAMEMGDSGRARELYQTALEVDPVNTIALKWLAYHTEDPHEGCFYLEKLIAVQPDNMKARKLLEAGRRRCQELDQESFNNLLSFIQEVKEEPTESGPAHRPIGELLVEKGYISIEHIETAANLQEMFKRAGSPMKLGEILLEFGLVSREQLQRVLTEQGLN